VIERGQGNLLTADVEALVNPVNTEGIMGKGLALQFRKAFPEVFHAYERACRAGDVRVGRMFVVERLASPRYVIHFPTKTTWRQPSRLEYVRDGLRDLIRVISDHGIRSIAVPPLGCGNGGLAWDDVRPLIEAALGEVPALKVILYAPDGAPDPRELVDRRERPAMTPGRAALIALVDEYLTSGFGYEITLVEIQKLAYFMQVAGQPLRLEFKPHFYGPYADTLRKVLRHVDGHFLRGVGDGTKPTTPVTIVEGAANEARAGLVSDPEVRRRLERVRALFDGFESPIGMELLATVHWVMAHEPGAADDLDAAVRGVESWSSRKKSKMGRQQISAAWTRLREHGWIDGRALTARAH
jgi:O-acetyl-ADP-ribose deacetylase (regulator of RNase III)